MPNYRLLKNISSSLKKNRTALKLYLIGFFICFCAGSYGVKKTPCNVHFIHGGGSSKKPQPRLTVNGLLTQARNPLPEIRKQAALKTRLLKTKKSLSVLNMLKNDPNTEVKKEVLISSAYKVLEGGFEILSSLKKDSNPYIKGLAKKTIKIFNYLSAESPPSAKTSFQNQLGDFIESIAEVKWMEPLEILSQKNQYAETADNVEGFNSQKDAQRIAFSLIEDLQSGNSFSRLAAVFFLKKVIKRMQIDSSYNINGIEHFLLQFFLEEENSTVILGFIKLFKELNIKNADVLSAIYEKGILDQNNKVQNAVQKLIRKARRRPLALMPL